MIMVISLFTIFFIVNNIQNNKRHKVFKQYSVNGFCFQIPKAIIKNTEQIKRQDTSICYEDNVTKFYAKDISKEDTINSSVDIADYVSKNDSIEFLKKIGEIVGVYLNEHYYGTIALESNSIKTMYIVDKFIKHCKAYAEMDKIDIIECAKEQANKSCFAFNIPQIIEVFN